MDRYDNDHWYRANLDSLMRGRWYVEEQMRLADDASAGMDYSADADWGANSTRTRANQRHMGYSVVYDDNHQPTGGGSSLSAYGSSFREARAWRQRNNNPASGSSSEVPPWNQNLSL